MVLIENRPNLWKDSQVPSIGRLFFNRPVDRSRSISTVNKDSPTWEYGRYQPSIWIDLLENPAKMAEKWPRFGGPWSSWQQAWTMNWVDLPRTSADKWMWSGWRAVLMRTGRRAELLGVKLGFPRSRWHAVVSDVLYVRPYSDAHFCSPRPISNASHKTTHKKETNTRTHFQRFSQNNSQERNKHADKVYDGHRVKSISRRSWWWKNYLVNSQAFWVPPLTCDSSSDASNAWPFGPAAFFREVRKKRPWPMVPYGPISDEKWSWTHIYKKVMVPWVVRNAPKSYLIVDTYPLIYQPCWSITVDIDGR